MEYKYTTMEYYTDKPKDNSKGETASLVFSVLTIVASVITLLPSVVMHILISLVLSLSYNQDAQGHHGAELILLAMVGIVWLIVACIAILIIAALGIINSIIVLAAKVKRYKTVFIVAIIFDILTIFVAVMTIVRLKG